MSCLAVVGKISSLKDIPGADRIDLAEVVCGTSGKWSGVVGKGSHSVGELVIVFLQDAILPPDPRWAFMEKQGWRVRMMRFKKQPSECVIVSGANLIYEIGFDLTGMLGVLKYSKPLPVDMNGQAKAPFPSFLPKTDEPNFQTVDFEALMSSSPFYVTEKADGSSCTAWVDEDGLHVASRNLELNEFDDSGATNAYWRTARKYRLESMPIGTAVQFEIVGPKIQGNPMGLDEIEARMFGMFEKSDSFHWEPQSVGNFFKCGLPLARELPCLYRAHSADELRKMAEIKYKNGAHGEGIVIRSGDQSWSFKVINLLYKES
jgi:RNA ligase (TIGR02306 family)